MHFESEILIIVVITVITLVMSHVHVKAHLSIFQKFNKWYSLYFPSSPHPPRFHLKAHGLLQERIWY